MKKQEEISSKDEKETKKTNTPSKNNNAFFQAEGGINVDVENAVVIDKGHFDCNCKMKCTIL